jgi:thioredoxin-like negative regulator of GroEL
MDKLFKIVSFMDPEEALAEITKVLERLLADLDDEARERFLMNLIGQSEGDKLSSLVHL